METEIVTKEPLKVKASMELGMGLRGCPWSGWARALGRLTASCIEMEGTAFMWVSGGLRAQGSMSALEPVSERRRAPLWPFRGVRRLV